MDANTANVRYLASASANGVAYRVCPARSPVVTTLSVYIPVPAGSASAACTAVARAAGSWTSTVTGTAVRASRSTAVSSIGVTEVAAMVVVRSVPVPLVIVMPTQYWASGTVTAAVPAVRRTG